MQPGSFNHQNHLAAAAAAYQHAASIQGNNNLVQCMIAEEEDHETGLALSPQQYTATAVNSNQTNGVADQGYYGSSDYSSENNNSYGMIAAQRLSVHEAGRHDKPQSRAVVQSNPAAINSTSSFTSSSLLSSPASCSPGLSTSPVFATTTTTNGQFKKSQHVHHLPRGGHKPAVTNLYPMGTAYQQQQQNAEVYFEKFERIYNSDVAPQPGGELEPSSQQHKVPNPYFYNSQPEPQVQPIGLKQQQQQQQRNSLSTYSYV